MTANNQEHRDYGFAIGLLAGTFVGAGLMMWFAPRTTSEVRKRVADSARDLSKRGQGVRNDVADTVARGAREVERFASAAKSDRITERL